MTDPRVSVVIPNHNYAQFVGQAVESVLGQTCPPFEVIIVDNGSDDESLEVLRAYSDRCRVIAQADLGQSGSRNRGVLETRGDWIGFLDADDVWLPTKLEEQLELVRPEVGLVYCSLELTDADLQPAQVLEARHRGRILDAFADYPGEGVVLGGESTAIVRREALARVGVFDPSLSISAGWDLWRRIATHYEVDYVRAPLVQYRQHGGNLHGRLARYEADVRRASRKLFDDPAAVAVHHRRTAYWAGLELVFAKSWAHARNPRRVVGRSLAHVGWRVRAVGHRLVPGPARSRRST